MWNVEGEEPDVITLRFGGTTIRDYDMGMDYWKPSFSATQLANTHFKPQRLRRFGDEPIVATDLSIDVDCSEHDCSKIAEPLFWKDTGSFDLHMTAKKRIDGKLEDRCEAVLSVDVVRDDELSALDIMMSHPDESLEHAHSDWHEVRDGIRPFPGEDWIYFHRALVRSFDEWRAFFGYDPIPVWDGSSPGPYAPRTVRCHCTGCELVSNCEPPPWFTPTGSQNARPDSLQPGSRGSCSDATGTRDTGGQTRLADFVDATVLGCVVNRTHHAAIHASFGKDLNPAMLWVKESTFDRHFWAYHKWASGFDVGDGSASLSFGQAGSPATSVWGAWEQERALGPPGISAVFPPRDRSLSRLTGVLVVLWEPVTGLAAGDLFVNGLPATSLEVEGSTYLFTGYASPGEGFGLSTAVAVTVDLIPALATDADGNMLDAATWSYTIAPDADDDGVPDDRDNCPDVANLDQRNSDVDLVHGVHAHGGEHPPVGSAGDPLGDACDIDKDNDGLSNDLEERVGSDPLETYDPDVCPYDPNKLDPGICGCGISDRDRDGDGEPECIPEPLLATTTTLQQSECGTPVSGGPLPSASDCLFVLRAAVSLESCIPACACAPTGVLPVSASDALRCLRVAVELGDELLCPCPDLPFPEGF